MGFDLSRRDALKLLALAMAAPCRAGVPDPPSHKDMGVCVYSFGRGRFKDAMEFLNYCHGIGASGDAEGRCG